MEWLIGQSSSLSKLSHSSATIHVNLKYYRSRKWLDWRQKTSILPFLVAGRCRNRPGTVSSSSARSTTRHGSRYISISGFGGHIAGSGHRSLSQSLGDTCVELAMVENAGVAANYYPLTEVTPGVKTS